MSDAEIIKEFLVESYENLDHLDQDLVVLEKDPTNRETLGNIFRTIHTIKGTSGFLAFNQLESLTHVGENLLAKLRDGALRLNPEITTALLAMVDAVRQMLRSIESTGNEGQRDDKDLAASLTRLLEGKGETAADRVPQGEPVSAAGAARSESAPAEKSTDAGREKLQAPEVIHPMEESAKPGPAAEAASPEQASRAPGASDSTIRVDVSLLDQLMNRVGELVLLRNQIVQYTNSTDDGELLGTSQRLNLLTTELQESVMKTRMQPIGNVWSKFPRTVRDVAFSCGKRVRIEMDGKETELDKTIIEAIKDPLTHLVRNAVDHGIEAPNVRQALGKSPEGLLFLRAFHEGGQVNIEITDDGAGLDLEKIRNKALQKSLITADQAARMSERELTNLIFLPGLSTAEKVTNVSGRGVGMDVVKTNIEKIGGTVDVQTRMGQGSTVRMKIPLTLAIIPALIITSAGDRYAIPQVSLLELVRLEEDLAFQGMEQVHGAPVYRLRGRLLPLVYLNHELKTETEKQRDCASRSGLPDFVQAREAHRQWITRLRQALAGHVSITPQQAGAFHDCALGKWLYSAGMRDFGAVSEIRTLEIAHRQFHELAQNIVSQHTTGNHEQAEQQLSEVESLSTKVIHLLTESERKISDYQSVNIVVLQADDRQFGLVVDEINDTEEIVVKPLAKELKSINTYAGATIMGDGRVALILDVLGLAQRAGVVGENREPMLAEKDGKQGAASAVTNQRRAVLLFQYGESGRMAVDLSLVARLEDFPRDSVEIAADEEVVQYRGQIMSLIRVSDVLGSQRKSKTADPESLHVVVYADGERSVGLVVDRILDIVEESFKMQRQETRPGVSGSAVIQQRVTDILDVPGLIAAAEQHHMAAGAPCVGESHA